MSIKFDLGSHIAKNKIWYLSDVLKPDVHYRLVDDIDNIASKAGVPSFYLTRSMTEKCTEPERDWFRNSKVLIDKGIFGLCYENYTFDEERLTLLASAFLRNYVNVKIISVQEVIEVCKSGSYPRHTVLLIPNFFISADSGGSIPHWQVSTLLGLLYSRMSKGLLTVIYCESLMGLATSYGDQFLSLINSHYKVIS